MRSFICNSYRFLAACGEYKPLFVSSCALLPRATRRALALDIPRTSA